MPSQPLADDGISNRTLDEILDSIVIQACQLLHTDAGANHVLINHTTGDRWALKPLGEIKTGEVVLVHAAAGGVGQAAVRLARHYGARVIGQIQEWLEGQL